MLRFDWHLHKDHKEDDALKAEELGEGVDEEVDDQEAILDGQHRLVTRQWELHFGFDLQAFTRNPKSFPFIDFVDCSAAGVDPHCD